VLTEIWLRESEEFEFVELLVVIGDGGGDGPSDSSVTGNVDG
jgi:hypothetical protein